MQITLTQDTCPFPSHDYFSATFINRNILIASLPQQQLPAANASAWPFWLNCNYLSDRFTLNSNYTVTIRNLVAVNCRTFSPVGPIRKTAGSCIRLENVVDVQGSVCLPPKVQYAGLQAAPRPDGVPGPAAAVGAFAGQQQLLALSATYNRSNWCQAAAQLNNSGPSGFGFESAVPATSDWALCQYPAVLVGDGAISITPFNTSEGTGPGQPYVFEAGQCDVCNAGMLHGISPSTPPLSSIGCGSWSASILQWWEDSGNCMFYPVCHPTTSS